MNDDRFLSSLKKLTEGNLSIGELIQSAEELKNSGSLGLALQLYKIWVQFNPDSPLLYVAHFNYATALTESGNPAGARASLERALELNPDFYPAYINLGACFEKLGLINDALGQWSGLVNRLGVITGSATRYKLSAIKQVGRILESNQMSANAELVFRQSLDLGPEQPDVVEHFITLRLAQCEWPIVVPWEGVERKSLMRWIGPLSMAAYSDDPMLQLAIAWNYNKNFLGYPAATISPTQWRAHAEPRPAKLKIGYVSSDLRGHAVGYLMAEFFELHDREAFEIVVYYCGPPIYDAMYQRIRATVEHWVDITGMDDASAANRIVADGIDILVDVNGYTRDARTKMFALRPAPVAVNWIGFPGTMGSPYHHYIVADDWIIPPESEIYYSEKVVRLPCYQPNDRRRVIAPTQPTRAEMNLPEGAMVYCCFNSVHKISRFTFERWIAILSRVPDSVLWLLGGSEGTNARLLEFAEQRGIARSRVIFAGRAANAEHLARYPLADLFLDTLPYGAHVTASDALWSGIPILTLSGRGFAARVCGSLSRAAGLPEMVCNSAEEYVDRAVELGTNPAEILRLKEKLSANRDSCVLFDTTSLVRHLEGLYREMWEDFLSGNLPRPDLSNLDVYLEEGITEDHDAQEILAIPDYRAYYQDKLARRHSYCGVPEDGRLWTAADIARYEAEGD